MTGARGGGGLAILQGSNLTTGAVGISQQLHPAPSHHAASSQNGRSDTSDTIYYHWSWALPNSSQVSANAGDHPANSSWPGGGGGSAKGFPTDFTSAETANSRVAMHFVWLLSLLALLLFLTLLGNVLICVVYRTRFRRNTASCFVIFLALLQLTFMTLGVPMEMSTLALPLLFRSDAACRLIRYVETAGILSLLLTLTAISLDRYYKLTRPPNFLGVPWAKRLCAGAVLLGLLLASPAALLFGTVKVHVTKASNWTETTCSVSRDTPVQTVKIVFVAVILLTFFFAFATMAVLYVLMFVKICRRKAASRGERVSPARPYRHRFVAEDSTSSCGDREETRRLPASSSTTSTSGAAAAAAACTPAGGRSGRTSPGFDPARVPLKASAKESARIGQGAGTVVDVQSTQMTWIFFLVSLFAVILLTPFMVLRPLQILMDLADVKEPTGLTVAYEVALRLYLLHPPLVPILYLMCNHNFLREVKLFLQKFITSCKQRPSPASSPAGTSNAN